MFGYHSSLNLYGQISYFMHGSFVCGIDTLKSLENGLLDSDAHWLRYSSP